MGIKVSQEQLNEMLAKGATLGPQAQIDRGGAEAKPHKYRAEKVTVDGIRFDSKREAKRYEMLMLMAQTGQITNLELQPAFDLHDKSGAKICTYKADFRYRNVKGTTVVEDAKGFKTPIYRLKKKWVESEYGITIVEV